MQPLKTKILSHWHTHTLKKVGVPTGARQPGATHGPWVTVREERAVGDVHISRNRCSTQSWMKWFSVRTHLRGRLSFLIADRLCRSRLDKWWPLATFVVVDWVTRRRSGVLFVCFFCRTVSSFVAAWNLINDNFLYQLIGWIKLYPVLRFIIPFPVPHSTVTLLSRIRY